MILGETWVMMDRDDDGTLPRNVAKTGPFTGMPPQPRELPEPAAAPPMLHGVITPDGNPHCHSSIHYH